MTSASKNPIFILAPMADFTDGPFCRIFRQVSGHNFVIFREMVSSEAIVRGNEKTLNMCEFEESERPLVSQIFGSDPEAMAQAAKIIDESYHPDGININMGCPVPKIAEKVGAGAALIKEADLAIKIIEKIKEISPDISLSVKTRLGWKDPNDIIDFTPRLEKAGINMLIIHGRTREQGYSGKADWGQIGKVKEIAKIPIIANGDVNTPEDIKKCLEITKADGIMMARGALGNPWIFKDPNKKAQVSWTERKQVMLDHAKLHLEHYGERGIVTFRKHLSWYFKSDKLGTDLPNLKEIRGKLVRVKSLDELKQIFEEITY